ncbi:MAG: Phosphoserine phosphatase RsbU, partial [Planctomycetota bacterium]
MTPSLPKPKQFDHRLFEESSLDEVTKARGSAAVIEATQSTAETGTAPNDFEQPQNGKAKDRLAIVLIEDNRIDSQIFREAVHRSGKLDCDITEFVELNTALHYLREHVADLVVIDLNLPDSVGLNTFREVRTACKSPIVVLTGDDKNDLAVEAVKLGAQDFLVKGSINMQTLSRAMQFACQRANLQRVEQAFAKQQKELEVLAQIQSHLLPSRPMLSLAKTQFSAAVYPADQAGGDYCDLVFSSPTRCDLIVADVSGHGLRASQSMLAVRATLRALCSQLRDPLEIMRTADRLLADELRAGDHFVTILLAVVDLDSATITHTSAGHAGYLLRGNQEVERLNAHVPPLGTIDIAWNETHRTVTHLQSRDLLCLPTDGVVEAINQQGTMFGIDRMLETLHT